MRKGEKEDLDKDNKIKKPMIKLSASLMCANFFNFFNEISILEKSKIDILHIDIMDGHFVRNFGFGKQFVERLAVHTKLPLEIHLMTEKPSSFIEMLPIRNGDIIIPHIEACDAKEFERCKDAIKQKGGNLGLGFKLETALENLENKELFLTDINEILLMAHKIGFSNIKLNPKIYDKLNTLNFILGKMKIKPNVAIDGGVISENAQLLVNHGTNILVCGTVIFNDEGTLKENIRRFSKTTGIKNE